MPITGFEVVPLREHVKERLLRELVEGALGSGEQIRVRQLAQRLSVSMTPAREALTQLETEGWVRLHPNRGFFAAPLSLSEARSIYPILGAMEALAVQLQGKESRLLQGRLREINDDMICAADNALLALECDKRWHEALVAGCTNAVLLDLLRTLRIRAERYERAYMRASGRISSSADDHHRIITALTRSPGRVPELLRNHWAPSSTFVELWLTAVSEDAASPHTNGTFRQHDRSSA
jgi:DNA-binding GntR family transcriptional regulator